MRASDTKSITLPNRGKAELTLLADRIDSCRKRHAEIIRKGTTDPFWPDGVCANIVRANIVYYLHLIQNLCTHLDIAYPPAGVSPELPARVSLVYMAKRSRAAQYYLVG